MEHYTVRLVVLCSIVSAFSFIVYGLILPILQIAFTGSTEVGHIIQKAAGESGQLIAYKYEFIFCTYTVDHRNFCNVEIFIERAQRKARCHKEPQQTVLHYIIMCFTVLLFWDYLLLHHYTVIGDLTLCIKTKPVTIVLLYLPKSSKPNSFQFPSTES